MNKRVLAIVFILACSSLLHGEEKTPKVGGPFEVELGKPASKYWMYVPEEYTPYRSMPLIVALHGAGDTAENFITAFTAEAKKNKYIVAAIKSQIESWTDNDEPIILAIIGEVCKKYVVDPERIFMVGFSAGARRTCKFGSRNFSLFRGFGIMGSMEEAVLDGSKEIKKQIALLVVCGDQDKNYSECKHAYETLKKQDVDIELHTMPGQGHTIDQTAVPWLFEKFQERLNKPEVLLKRGKKASAAKRYLDSIDCFKGILEQNKDGKKEDAIVKEAQQELKKIEKIAQDKYDQAIKKIDSKKKEEGAKLLKEIIAQHEGVPAWEKAKEKLNEIGPSEGKK